MKTRSYISILIILFLSQNLNGAISYKLIEYIPKGKNYTISMNASIFGYAKNQSNSEEILIIYGKTTSKDYYLMNLFASENLKKRLPLIVLKYIGNYIISPIFRESKSLEKAKEATKFAVERALDQAYKERLQKEGAEMVEDITYHRGYYNSKWSGYLPSYYYDYVPAFSTDGTIDVVLNKPDPKDVWKFASLPNITKKLTDFGYHHDVKSLAKWPSDIMNGTGTELANYQFNDESIKSDNEYHKRPDSCRFKLEKVNVKHGDRYPNFASVSYFSWVATYCNFFASDLQKKIFEKRLWNTGGCVMDSWRVPLNDDFLEIDKDKDYLNNIQYISDAGLIIFLLTAKHTTTIYSVDQDLEITVVQAGADVGILKITDVWPSFKTKRDVRALVYLGHLKK